MFICLLFANYKYATHNRGGEITYLHISGLTYEFTITTCTDIGSSTQTDRDELYLDFDLGTSYAQTDTLQRVTETLMPFDHQKNIYKGIHTFTSAGTLKVDNESYHDAVVDIINYMVLFSGFLKDKSENDLGNTSRKLSRKTK